MENAFNKNFVLVLGLLLLLNTAFVIAEETFIAKENITLIFTCTINDQIPSASTTYNLTIANHLNGSILIDNDEAVSLGNGIFNYNFSFPESGRYLIISACYDGVNNDTSREIVEVTPTGNKLQLYDVLVQGLLLTFFLFLCFSFYMIKRQINFDAWFTRVQNKYQSRNTPRAIFASLGYFFVKESFMVYFLLIFPIIAIIINLITAYNIGSMEFLVNILLILYSVGVIISGVLMFGKFQEFVMDRIEETKNFNWGIQR